MDQKTISWVSYLTLIGWIIALVTYNSSPDKSSIAKFHLRQSFGIMVTGVVLWIAISILSTMFFIMMPFLFFVISFFWFAVWVGMVVLWLLGLIAAANGEEKPVPLFGALYQKIFTFIN